jgi:hypothetical protein
MLKRGLGRRIRHDHQLEGDSQHGVDLFRGCVCGTQSATETEFSPVSGVAFSPCGRIFVGYFSMTEKLSTFTNHSRYRRWSEEECRLMINAALLKLIDDAGGQISISTADMLKTADKGSLAMAVSDDDRILTLTRMKEEKNNDAN